MITRSQLSLYVPAPMAEPLESVRRVVDPVQSSLIPAHVTLCREDELAQLEPGVIASRLATPPVKSVTLQFGKAESFYEHGILLPCVAGEHEFRSLREHLLGSRNIRHQSPHITLAHPRNPKAHGNCLASAHMLPESFSIAFSTVTLIEQTGIAPWRVLDTFYLQGTSALHNHSFKPKPLRGSA